MNLYQKICEDYRIEANPKYTQGFEDFCRLYLRTHAKDQRFFEENLWRWHTLALRLFFELGKSRPELGPNSFSRQNYVFRSDKKHGYRPFNHKQNADPHDIRRLLWAHNLPVKSITSSNISYLTLAIYVIAYKWLNPLFGKIVEDTIIPTLEEVGFFQNTSPKKSIIIKHHIKIAENLVIEKLNYRCDGEDPTMAYKLKPKAFKHFEELMQEMEQDLERARWESIREKSRSDYILLSALGLGSAICPTPETSPKNASFHTELFPSLPESPESPAVSPQLSSSNIISNLPPALDLLGPEKDRLLERPEPKRRKFSFSAA